MENLFNYLNYISPLSPEAQAALASLFTTIQLEPKDFFIREGKYAKRIGFLETGVCRAFFVNKEGKEYNKQFFVGPSLVGAYAALLTGEKNKIAQQCLTSCKIWVAPYQEIVSLFSKHPDLERLGRKIAEFYFLEKEQKELEMALLDADKRYLIFRDAFPELEMQIPQYHIASYLGISATQLSRIRRNKAGR